MWKAIREWGCVQGANIVKENTDLLGNLSWTSGGLSALALALSFVQILSEHRHLAPWNLRHLWESWRCHPCYIWSWTPVAQHLATADLASASHTSFSFQPDMTSTKQQSHNSCSQDQTVSLTVKKGQPGTYDIINSTVQPHGLRIVQITCVTTRDIEAALSILDKEEGLIACDYTSQITLLYTTLATCFCSWMSLARVTWTPLISVLQMVLGRRSLLRDTGFLGLSLPMQATKTLRTLQWVCAARTANLGAQTGPGDGKGVVLLCKPSLDGAFDFCLGPLPAHCDMWATIHSLDSITTSCSVGSSYDLMQLGISCSNLISVYWYPNLSARSLLKEPVSMATRGGC